MLYPIPVFTIFIETKWVAIIILNLLLAAKTFEIMWQIYYMISNHNTVNFIPNNVPWHISIWLRKCMSQACYGFIFRLPILLNVCTLLLLTATECHWFLYLAMILIFSSIWSQLLLSFASRLIIGPRDIDLMSNAVALQGKYFDKPDRKAKPLQDSVLFIAALAEIIFFGYAGMYYSLLNLDPKAFSDTLQNFGDSIYFSLVTFATVGYGDIYPKSEFARFLVSSEILTSMASLVLLVLAFSLTDRTDQNGTPTAPK
jgi:hypothetical protein